MNAAAAEPAGTRLSKILNMVNTSMFVFKHPKYYKELRDAGNELAPASAVKEDLTSSGSSPARNKSDQAISDEASTEATSVRPDPGHKQRDSQVVNQVKLSSQSQAPSSKPQASSFKRQAPEASSRKLQAPSNKRQA